MMLSPWGGSVGPEKRDLIYSEATGKWWNISNKQPQDTPYSYPIEGTFREKATPQGSQESQSVE